MESKTKVTPTFLFLCVLLFVTLALIAAVRMERPGSQRRVWDMPMAFPDSNYQTKTAKEFAKDVYACTNGGLEIRIHANGSLFKGNEIKRAVETGQVPIGENLLSIHANANAMFTVDSIPFIASSFDESERLWRVAEPYMEQLLSSEHLHLLYSVPWPPQGIYFKHAINRVADMAGLRFRSYSYATGRIAALAGMTPVMIESSEINQALATGVVETMMASGSSGYDSKIWENLDYYYDIEAWRPRNYVFVNREAYNELPEDMRACLTRAAAEAQARGTKESIRLGDWYLEELRKNGMQVVKPGPQLKADLDKIGGAMTAEWLHAVGPNGNKILDAYGKK